MGAGGRADEQAQRGAERVARERAAVEAARARLDAAEAQQRAWQAGAEGERATATALDELTAAGWLLLHDVHWPGRPKANVDHVAVGPGGVVVIDSKNWSYPATVRGGQLWTGRYSKRRECEDVARMAASVAVLLAPAHRSLVRGAVCLVQQELGATRAEPGVVVVGLGQLAACLRSLPGVLAPGDVHDVHDWLGARLGAVTSPAQLTTAALATGARRQVPSASAEKGPRRARRGSARGRRRDTRRAASRQRSVLGLAVAALLAFWVFPAWVGAIQDAVTTEVEDQFERVEPAPAPAGP